MRSTTPYGMASAPHGMLPYHPEDPKILTIRSFGIDLEPR